MRGKALAFATHCLTSLGKCGAFPASERPEAIQVGLEPTSLCDVSRDSTTPCPLGYWILREVSFRALLLWASATRAQAGRSKPETQPWASARGAQNPAERRERERERERAARPAVRGGPWGSSPEEMRFSSFFYFAPKSRAHTAIRKNARRKFSKL